MPLSIFYIIAERNNGLSLHTHMHGYRVYRYECSYNYTEIIAQCVAIFIFVRRYVAKS